MIFYTSDSGLHDWYTNTNDLNSKRDNLWGNPNATKGINPDKGSKSIYDPCPVGWRVPPQDAWQNLSTSNFKWDESQHGCKLTTSEFYPATGCIICNNGVLFNDSGTKGNYWLSSTFSSSGSHGAAFRFEPKGPLDSDYQSNYRAYGFPIRCSRE